MNVKAEVRGQRSEVALVQHLVDPVADPLQVGSVDLGGPVQGGQEVAVGEVVEDVVDARVALGRQVAPDGLVQQLAALVQQGAHHAPVEGELDLVEADRRHGQSVDFLPAGRPGREGWRDGVRRRRRRGCQLLTLTRAEAEGGKNRKCWLV